MTRRAYAGLTVGAVVCIALVGFILFASLFTDEYWCTDRSPWWGPPKDSTSTCSGHSWAKRHPGEYPWALPK